MRTESGFIEDFVFSSDGRLVAWALDDGFVEVFEDGVKKQRIAAQEGAVRAISFLDSKRLVTHGRSGAIRVFDLETGKQIGPDRSVHQDCTVAAFSPDGETAAAGYKGGRVRLTTLSDGSVATFQAHQKAVLSLSFSADGKRLLTTSRDGTAAVWSVEKTRVRSSGRRPTVETVESDSNALERGYLLRRLHGHDGDVTDAEFASTRPGESVVFTTSLDRVLRVFDYKSGVEMARLTAHAAPLIGIGVAPDGGTILTAGTDRSVRVFTFEHADDRVLVEAPDSVRAIAFAADGSEMAAGTESGAVRVSGVSSLDIVPHARPITALAFAQRSDRLATASAEEGVKITSLSDELLVADLGHREAGVRAMAFTPDGLGLAIAGEDHIIRLIDPANGRELRRLEGHTGPVESITVSADGQLIASGGRDRSIRVWTVEDGRESLRLEGHMGPVSAVVFSTDAKVIYSASADRTVRRWGVIERAELGRVPHDHGVLSLALEPEAGLLATVSENGEIRLFDAGFSDVARMGCGRGLANVVAFSPKEEILAAGCADRTVRLFRLASWSTPADELAARAQSDFGLRLVKAQLVMSKE